MSPVITPSEARVRKYLIPAGLSTQNFLSHLAPFITLNYYQKIIRQLSNELLEIEDELTVFRGILSAASDPILITNIQMRIVYVNPSWEKMSGYSFDEVVGHEVDSLESSRTPKKLSKKIWQSLSHNKPYRTEEVIEKKKDGSEYQVYSSFFPVQKNKRTIFYVQIQHDITERKKLENQKKEFLATASHELKTPITTLRLLTDVLGRKIARESGIPQKKFKELSVIDHELCRLTKLINDIIDISRLETGKFHLQPQEVELKGLLTEVIGKMRLIIDDHKLTLSTLPNIVVIADPHRIEQVLINLITNAAKFSSPKTAIEISLKINGKFAQVEVHDYGVGIPKKELEFIFDRFYQVKEHLSTGFGLGLYIAKEIITQHKGRIWASTNKTAGCTFHFCLPIRNNARVFVN